LASSLSGVVPWLGKRDPNADADRHSVVTDRKFLRYRCDKAIGNLHGATRIAVTADNGEFVTAETGDHIIRPQYVAHSARRLPQHGVAARMTEDVVHLLEPIQIKTDDCKLLVASPRPLQPRSQLLIQGGSIGNPGQRIMVYKIAYASFSSLSLADITYRVDAPSAALVESFPHRDFNGDSRLVSRDQVH
jgi:hypothetical protein